MHKLSMQKLQRWALLRTSGMNWHDVKNNVKLKHLVLASKIK